MKKTASKILSVALLLVVIISSLSLAAFATTNDTNGAFNNATSVASATRITGYDDNSSGSTIVPYASSNYHSVVCASSADIGKKLLTKAWRGEGQCTLTSMEPFYTPSWDITLNTDLYYKGHYYTKKDKTSYQSDNCIANTKYVNGSSESQFGVHVTCVVKDDNGVKVWDKTHTKGNPFN